VKHCDCCQRDVPDSQWDGIYSACDDCAWCHSFQCEPCCHGACHPQGQRVRPPATEGDDDGDDVIARWREASGCLGSRKIDVLEAGESLCAEVERLRRNVRELRSGCKILLGYVGDNRMRDILESMLELSSSALEESEKE